jgi:hypothetical protein
VIPIDVGRQLFVDDFLIEQTSMVRVFHLSSKYVCNPIVFPQSAEERNPAYPPCAIAKCGGVAYDERDARFKMWYIAGYVGAMAYAESDDGVHWERPLLDVVPGTNLFLPRDVHPDSGTVWLDKETADEKTRFKFLLREPNEVGKGNAPALVMTSPDGIHWSQPVRSGPMGDRTTMFYNPFRKKWVYSIRGGGKRGRSRYYWEHDDFLEGVRWQKNQPVPWTSADCMDEGGDSLPQLYNLDAVAYESIILSAFQILKGPPNPVGESQGLPKLTELTLGYSRDGFHWHRPDRRAFIGANRVPGSWEYGYVESSGGVCLIVGDELWFYYSAYAGDPRRITKEWCTNGMYANGAVGLAKLRRDGFASMQARIAGAYLLTRPLIFAGDRLFVNANTAGAELRVEAIDDSGEPFAPYTLENCVPFIGNSTCAGIHWQNSNDLAALRNHPVRFRFSMDRGELYAFWVTDSPTGASHGYVGGGGPGFTGPKDTV